ncbi:hypothetical protein ACHQM5_027065 [Ranunculus cassubicifolius]
MAILGIEQSNHRSVYGKKHNRCVIFPASVDIIADGLERQEQQWFVQTKAASDLIVKVGESSFHLHKLHMVSKSVYLNRLVLQRSTNGDAMSSSCIHIENLPGGDKIFQLVVKFCYGLVLNLTAFNVAPLFSAAHFLEMTEDFERGNLMSKAETFLKFVMFSSWKDTFKILKSLDDVSLWAEDLGLLRQCSESIAWKACLDPRILGRCVDDELHLNVTKNMNSRSDGNGQIVEDTWWFEDVSVLGINHFVRVVKEIKAKGMKPRLVGGCIAYWTSKWLQQSKLGKRLSHEEVQRDTFEKLIRVLPKEKDSVCINFLLHLLKVGIMLNINSELTIELERRVATMLESCCAANLLVQNHNDNDTVYDVRLITQVLEVYVTCFSRELTSRMDLVGRLVDDYLILIARDCNLTIESFQLLAEVLPERSRHCNNKLYRAIDMYLKAHPTLTEAERRSICRALEFHKLSQEARKHAMKNDRLPLNITARLILWEQVNITKSILCNTSNYRRSKSQEIVRLPRRLHWRWFRTQKEIQRTKAEIEKMKTQLCHLQDWSIELRRQVKIGLR